jgi:hypothetical protein
MTRYCWPLRFPFTHRAAIRPPDALVSVASAVAKHERIHATLMTAPRHPYTASKRCVVYLAVIKPSHTMMTMFIASDGSGQRSLSPRNYVMLRSYPQCGSTVAVHHGPARCRRQAETSDGPSEQ